MDKKVYIAGKVTGEDYHAAFGKFKATQDILEGIGFTVINPMNIVPQGTSWTDSMKILLPLIKECDYLFLLPDWRESPGAKIEVDEAKRNNVEIVIYEHISKMQWIS